MTPTTLPMILGTWALILGWVGYRAYELLAAADKARAAAEPDPAVGEADEPPAPG